MERMSLNSLGMPWPPAARLSRVLGGAPMLDRRGGLRPYRSGVSREALLNAIVIREFGPPSVLKLEEVPTPEPGPGEVLLKVHAVSVNRTLDTKVRAGKYARQIGRAS